MGSCSVGSRLVKHACSPGERLRGQKYEVILGSEAGQSSKALGLTCVSSSQFAGQCQARPDLPQQQFDTRDNSNSDLTLDTVGGDPSSEVCLGSQRQPVRTETLRHTTSQPYGNFF